MKFYTITCLYIDYTIMQIKKKTIDVFWLLVERNWAKLIVFCQEKTLKHSVLFVSSWGINLYWSIQKNSEECHLVFELSKVYSLQKKLGK